MAATLPVMEGLSLYDMNRQPRKKEGYACDGQVEDEHATVSVDLRSLNEELKCPICLGILRKTTIVMSCLHRFCQQCIEKSLRVSAGCCPACREKIASRRSLRPDKEFDALISTIYPDLDAYEDHQRDMMESVSYTHNRRRERPSATRLQAARSPKGSGSDGDDERADNEDGNGDESDEERREASQEPAGVRAASESLPTPSSDLLTEPLRLADDAPQPAPVVNEKGNAGAATADSREVLKKTAEATESREILRKTETRGRSASSPQRPPSFSPSASAAASSVDKRSRGSAGDETAPPAKRARTEAASAAEEESAQDPGVAGPAKRKPKGRQLTFEAVPHHLSVVPRIPRPCVNCTSGIQVKQLKNFIAVRSLRTWDQDPEGCGARAARVGLTREDITEDALVLVDQGMTPVAVRDGESVIQLLSHMARQSRTPQKKVYFCHRKESMPPHRVWRRSLQTRDEDVHDFLQRYALF